MEAAREAIRQFPGGYSFLADELCRNTSSVSRSFAEGYYYDSTRQQRRYFGYAIQSAREASASFDTARAFGVCREETIRANARCHQQQCLCPLGLPHLGLGRTNGPLHRLTLFDSER